MQRKLIKNMLLVLTLAVLCFSVGVTASAKELAPIGQCGDNVYWTFDETTGELVINGEGEMWEYSGKDKSSPFSSVDAIKSIDIEHGITMIPEEYFRDCNNLTSVNIAGSVTTIEYMAFIGCYNLKNLNISNGVEFIGEHAFRETGITSINIPESVTNISGMSFYSCVCVRTITIPNSKVNIETASLVTMPYLDKIIVKSMNANFEELAIGSFLKISLPYDEFMNLWSEWLTNGSETANQELANHIIYAEQDNPFTIGTIYCHEGSTAENYAIENGYEYVLTHFGEGDWTYDYDNLVRYRKCIHCDELEIEAIESDASTEPGTPASPEEETKDDIFAKIFDLIKAFFELIMSMFK